MNLVKKLFNRLYEEAQKGNEISKIEVADLLRFLSQKGAVSQDVQNLIAEKGSALLKEEMERQDYDSLEECLKSIYEMEADFVTDVPEDFMTEYKNLLVNENMIDENGVEKEPPMSKEEFKAFLTEKNALRQKEIDMKTAHVDSENQFLSKFYLDDSVKFFFENASKDLDPFKIIEMSVPTDLTPEEEKRIKLSYARGVGQMVEIQFGKDNIEKIGDVSFNDYLRNFLKIGKKEGSLADIVKELHEKLNELPNKERLIPNGTNKNYFTMLMEKMHEEKKYDVMTSLPNMEKYYPAKSQFASPLENPSISDQPLKNVEVDSILNTLAEDDPNREILEATKTIIVEGNPHYVGLTSNIAENAGEQDERYRATTALAHLKAKSDHPEDYKLASANIEFADGERTIAAQKRSIENPIPFRKEFVNGLLDLVHEIQNDGVFDFTSFNTEEGTKVYGFKNLLNAKRAVVQAVKDKDTAKIVDATKKYQELEKKYDTVIAKLKEFNETGLICANISVSRNGEIPGKYRSDYYGATLLNQFFINLGSIHANGLDIQAFFENPLVSISTAIDKAYQEDYLVTSFRDNIHSREDLIKLLVREREHHKVFTDKLAETTTKIHSFYRTLNGMMTMLNLEKDADLIDDIVLFSEKTINQNVQETMFMRTFTDKMPENFANILLVKDKDFNPKKLNNAVDSYYNHLTFAREKTISLPDYYKEFTYTELAEKFAEIYRIGQANQNDEAFKDAIQVIQRTFENCKSFNELAYMDLKNILTTGKSTILDSIRNKAKLEVLKSPLENRPEDAPNYQISENLAKLFNDYISLKEISFGCDRQMDNPAHELKSLMDETIAQHTLGFYTDQIKNEFVKQGIHLEELGFGRNEEAVFQALNAMVNNDDRFKNVSFSSEFMEKLSKDSLENVYHRVEVPQQFKDTNPEAAQQIEAAYVGTNPSLAGSLQPLEFTFTDPTADEISKKPVENYINQNENMKASFKFGAHNAFYEPYKKGSNLEQVIQDFDKFKVSQETKNKIITVYNKMKDYNMLIDFDPAGEEGQKIYGFHKYYNQYIGLRNAVNAGDMTKATEIASTQETIVKEYKDVLDTCEKLFPQDKMHNSGNLTGIRNSYMPLEFNEKLQPHIQMHGVYMIANLCHQKNIKIEEFLDNPSKVMKSFLQDEKNNLQKRLAKDDNLPGKTIVETLNNTINRTNLVASRGIEALLCLEENEEIRKTNGVINCEFSNIYGKTASLNLPFVNAEDLDVPRGTVDYEMLKQFVAARGSVPTTNFLKNTYDFTTGKLYENTFDYAKFIERDPRTTAQIYKDMLEDLKDAILLTYDNSKLGPQGFMQRNIVKFSHLYVASAMYFKDVVAARGLENDNSLDALAMKQFIQNPNEVFEGYLNHNYQDKISRIARFEIRDGGVEDELIAKNIGYKLENGAEYYNSLLAMSASDLEREFNTLFQNVHENMGKILLVARAATASYSARSRFLIGMNRSANKEVGIVANARDLAVTCGITTKVYEDIVENQQSETYLTSAGHANILAGISKKIEEFSPENIRKDLDKIFCKGNVDDLTREQLLALGMEDPEYLADIQLKKEAQSILSGNKINSINLKSAIDKIHTIQKVIEVSKAENLDKDNLETSIELIQMELESKGLSREVQTTLINGTKDIDSGVDAANEALVDRMQVEIDLGEDFDDSRSTIGVFEADVEVEPEREPEGEPRQN